MEPRESETPKPRPEPGPVAVSPWTALGRGLRRRCPRCGTDPLFGRWFSRQEGCSACGLRYEQNPGDTWAFWLIGDRIFLALLIIAVFLVFRSDSVFFAFVLLVATAVPLVATMPHRMGLCIALDFLARTRWGDLAEGPSAVEGPDIP
jgi:uncharacterized protein (DUF983 family)